MKSQRGIIAAIWLYLLAGVAIIGGIWYVYHYIDHHWETSAGIKRGEEIKQAAWNDANRAAQAAADQERATRAKLAGEQSAKLATAEGKAKDSDARWRQARAAAARASIPLVVGECPQSTGAVAGGAPGSGAAVPDIGITLRLTWTFVRLWDGAWTGSNGESLYGDSSRYAEAAGGTSATPYTIETALDNHAENASRADACRRSFNGLIDLLEKLRAR